MFPIVIKTYVTLEEFCSYYETKEIYSYNLFDYPVHNGKFYIEVREKYDKKNN